MCFAYFKMNKFEKNPQKYIKEKCSFLISNIHNNKKLILKDKMIYYRFRKIEFEYPRVQSVELHNKRYLKIVYDNKNMFCWIYWFFIKRA